MNSDALMDYRSFTLDTPAYSLEGRRPDRALRISLRVQPGGELSGCFRFRLAVGIDREFRPSALDIGQDRRRNATQGTPLGTKLTNDRRNRL